MLHATILYDSLRKINTVECSLEDLIGQAAGYDGKDVSVPIVYEVIRSLHSLVLDASQISGHDISGPPVLYYLLERNGTEYDDRMAYYGENSSSTTHA